MLTQVLTFTHKSRSRNSLAPSLLQTQILWRPLNTSGLCLHQLIYEANTYAWKHTHTHIFKTNEISHHWSFIVTVQAEIIKSRISLLSFCISNGKLSAALGGCLVLASNASPQFWGTRQLWFLWESRCANERYLIWTPLKTYWNELG